MNVCTRVSENCENFGETLNYCFEQGKANGNREYSSMIVNKYLFLDLLGRGPLKFLRNRVFQTTFGIKEICRTAINWD